MIYRVGDVYEFPVPSPNQYEVIEATPWAFRTKCRQNGRIEAHLQQELPVIIVEQGPLVEEE